MRDDNTRPCWGCGGFTETPTHQSGRAWCERCSHLSADVYAADRAARILASYGFDAAAAAIARAIEEARVQLRDAAGPVHDKLTIAIEDERRRKIEEARSADVLERLRTLINETQDDDDALTVPAQMTDDELRAWLQAFAAASCTEEPPEDDQELLARFRGFLSSELEQLAASCRCGHLGPHGNGRICWRGRCGCGSARRTAIANALARVQALSEDDLLAAWPKPAE